MSNSKQSGERSESRHTPGPWIAELGYGNAFVMAAGDRLVAAAAEVIPCSDEDRANARLIAAAPELLEALRAVDREMDEHIRATGGRESWAYRIQDAVRAAIAKAKGE